MLETLSNSSPGVSLLALLLSLSYWFLVLTLHIQAPQAIKVLEDGVTADIIKIRNQVANKEVGAFRLIFLYSICTLIAGQFFGS